MAEGTVVCLSGGLDSAVVCELMRKDGPVFALIFDYNQPHKVEIEYARAFCTARRIEHRIVRVPMAKSGLLQGPEASSPVVAGRNAIMLSIAASVAQTLGFHKVAFGPTAEDHDLFPDCRWEFVDAMSTAFEHGGYGVQVVAPLLEMDKREIAYISETLGIGRDETWSCYFPVPWNPERGRPSKHATIHAWKPCGKCLACQVRAYGFGEGEAP